MERLNDNEVKEIARMQSMIDSYEGFILATSMMMISERDITVPQFGNTNLDKEMGRIWKWIKEHKEK